MEQSYAKEREGGVSIYPVLAATVSFYSFGDAYAANRRRAIK
jgi:hypothetical protein